MQGTFTVVFHTALDMTKDEFYDVLVSLVDDNVIDHFEMDY